MQQEFNQGDILLAMLVKGIEVGILAVNCYLVGCEKTREGIVIDPGGSANRILEEIKKMNLQITAIINTHGHYDHIGANNNIKKATGAPILLPKDDLEIYRNPGKWLSIFLKTQPLPDQFIGEGDLIPCGSLEIKVLKTPGHTPGGVCLLVEAERTIVFTGDTLFNFSIGRVDLAGGSYKALIKSVKEKLLTLPDESIVCPGHGPSSTIGQERQFNPFFA